MENTRTLTEQLAVIDNTIDSAAAVAAYTTLRQSELALNRSVS